jgi:bifunctional UDP-N-acetylglucosamine pyrophosphorylase/glucosamine-1-phosphate N-acetyltransferase
MTEKIATIILAAGKGTRMKSDLPKVVHSARGQSLIHRVIQQAAPLGAERTIIVTGYQKELVEKAALQSGMPSLVFCEQREQRGTGDAARAALPGLSAFKGSVVILYGDAPLITTRTLKALLEHHARAKATITILSFIPEDLRAYGRIIRDTKTQVPLKIVEAKDCTPEELQICECNSGIYVVDSSFLEPALKALEPTNAQGEYYLTDIVEKAMKEGQTVSAFIAPDPNEAEGVNTLADLAFVERVLLEREKKQLEARGITLRDPHSLYFDPEVTIGDGCVIGQNVTLRGATKLGASVEIEGSAYLIDTTVDEGALIRFSVRSEQAAIGKNAKVGPFAHLRPGTVLSEEVHIGNFVETKNATLAHGVKANHLTYLGDCAIGARTNIGAGTITCNYDGKKKSKTTIGEEVFVGSDTCLIAPITIGDRVTIGAGSVLSKDVADDSLALTRAELTIRRGWKRK